MSVADDQYEIRNLISRLARSTDIGTVDEYLEAFTDDAVLEIPGRPPRQGLEGLREGSAEGRQAGAAGPGSHTMHMVGSSSVSLNGDTAVVHTPWVVYRETATNPTIGTVGRYEDTFARTPGGWRLRHRTIAFG